MKIGEELADSRVLINQLNNQVEILSVSLESEKEKNKILMHSEEALKKRLEELTLDFSKANYRISQAEKENKALREEFYESNLNVTHHSEVLLTE